MRSSFPNLFRSETTRFTQNGKILTGAIHTEDKGCEWGLKEGMIGREVYFKGLAP